MWMRQDVAAEQLILGEMWLSLKDDSRYLNVISVLDEIIRNVELSRFDAEPSWYFDELSRNDRVVRDLQHLLGNTLKQVSEENRHMRGICYPEGADHEADHFMICKTIAGLCSRWARSRADLMDLYELHDLILQHIQSHDGRFERYLSQKRYRQ